MLRLKKILKRSTKKFSIINAIDTQLVMESKKVYSKRMTLITLDKLRKCIVENADWETTNIAFDNFYEAFNMPHTRDTANIHPSELLQACPRALFYRLTKVPTTNTKQGINAQLQRIFDNGTWFHRYVQSLLRKSGLLESAEVGFHNTDLNLIGHTDGILKFVIDTGVKRMILEVKTINSFGFANIIKKGKPNDYHVYQASIYARELNIDAILFLYYNKDTSDMHEYVIHKKDFIDFQNDAYEKIESINESVNNNELPKRMCKSVTEEMAMSCQYCNHCFNL